MSKAVNLAAAFATVGLVSTIVQARNAADVISSVGDAFSGSIRAALGRTDDDPTEIGLALFNEYLPAWLHVNRSQYILLIGNVVTQ